MDKFTFKRVQNIGNKAKKALINDTKHAIVYGRNEEAEVDRMIASLEHLGVYYRPQYEKIEAHRRMGVAIS